MAKQKSRRLVIDASVMRAAGEPLRTAATSTKCRKFLMEVRSICHRVLLTTQIDAEWRRHSSRWAQTSHVEMRRIRKVESSLIPPDDELRDRVTAAAADHHVAQILIKEIHLIEAALRSDRTVISLDDTARNQFAKASESVKELGAVVWVNPSVNAEQAVKWLHHGAKEESQRKLGYAPA